MGKRGPAPKPTKLKKLQGTYREDRAPENEPEPPLGAPACPDWLNDLAKEEWQRIVPDLIEVGLLTKIDRAALAGYCHAWSEWQQMEADIEEEGIDQLTGTGTTQRRPQVMVRDKAIERCYRFAKEFGLTPSSRTGISVPEKRKDSNPFSRLGS